MKRLKLWYLKRKAKILYLKLRDYEADCGRSLLTYVSYDYSKMQQEFNKTMLDIQKLDNQCPTVEDK